MGNCRICGYSKVKIYVENKVNQEKIELCKECAYHMNVREENENIK